jgi:hypothetical protein
MDVRLRTAQVAAVVDRWHVVAVKPDVVKPEEKRTEPRHWCAPSKAFGSWKATDRVWLVPEKPYNLERFRAAVLQHAIAVSVRQHKTREGITQEQLSEFDGRGDAKAKWNARLNGRIALTMVDLGVLVRFLPGALPEEEAMEQLLKVAEGVDEPPLGWRWPDRSSVK